MGNIHLYYSWGGGGGGGGRGGGGGGDNVEIGIIRAKVQFSVWI